MRHDAVEGHPTDRLLYRRQFLLGPEPLGCPSSWRRVSLQDGRCLAVHPDLELEQTNQDGKSLTLLGFMLDPGDPSATNADILESLAGKFTHCEEVIEHLAGLGGRWALLVSDGDRSILVHDAAGLRQVYYAGGKTIWCASETGLLARALALRVDPEAEALNILKDCRIGGVYWWPGDTSMYREVRALLPNHYLDLDTGEVHRYWPLKAIGALSFEDAVVRSARILRGVVESARRRYDLALSFTAGWDSRLMLAISREIIDEIYCFTLTYQHYTKRTPDLAVPLALSRRFGFDLEVIPVAEQVGRDFERAYRESIPSIHPEGIADIQAMYERYPRERVCVAGLVAEVTKRHYGAEEPGPNVDARRLAQLSNMGIHPFALDAYARWLSGVNGQNIRVLDLFCWEQFAGRWQARIGGTYDLVHESFNPYNCRALLETMLAVDERYRRPPSYDFHRALIASLWEDVLLEPINPPDGSIVERLARYVLRKARASELLPRSVLARARKVLG